MFKLSIAFVVSLVALQGVYAVPIPEQTVEAGLIDGLLGGILGEGNLPSDGNLVSRCKRDSATTEIDVPDIKGYFSDLVDKYFNGGSDGSSQTHGVLLKRGIEDISDDDDGDDNDNDDLDSSESRWVGTTPAFKTIL